MDTFFELMDSAFTEKEFIAETGRFLYVYNSTTLIASVGAIVGLVLLGSLLWIAISSALKEEKHGGYGGGYRKRSADEEEERQFSAVDLLIMLDETFSALEIDADECRKRAICEVFLKETGSKTSNQKLQRMALRIKHILNKIENQIQYDGEKTGSMTLLQSYLEASTNGKKGSCRVYNSCEPSFQDFVLRNPTKHKD